METQENIPLVTVSQLLESWGFKDYVPVFEAQDIDVEALLCLSDSDLKPLIDKTGPFVRFKKKLQELKDDSEKLKVLPPTPEQLSVAPASGINVLNNSEVSVEITSTVPEASQTSESEPVLYVVDRPGPSSQNNRKDTVAGYLNCTVGMRVLKNYESKDLKTGKEENKLDLSHQNILCQLIIDNELKDNHNKRLTTERFEELSNEIVEIFPKEVKSTYFIPYQAFKFNGKVVSKKGAKGKLWNRYTNSTKALIKDGLRSHQNRSTDKSQESNTTGLAEPSDASLRWLIGQNEITERVQREWKSTVAQRMTELRRLKVSRREDLPAYVNIYPFLRQNQGFSLLEQDFAFLFPDKENALFENWPECKRKLDKLPGNCEGQSDTSYLLKFANIVAQRQKKVKVNKSWTANTEEIIEGFILHEKVVDAVATSKSAIEKRAQKFKLGVSPFVILVGPTSESITDAYMYIDGVQFRAASPLHAVDQVFKAIHALNVCYAPQSECIWLLVQRAFYDITTEWDSRIPVVDELLPHLKN